MGRYFDNLMTTTATPPAPSIGGADPFSGGKYLQNLLNSMQPPEAPEPWQPTSPPAPFVNPTKPNIASAPIDTQGIFRGEAPRMSTAMPSSTGVRGVGVSDLPPLSSMKPKVPVVPEPTWTPGPMLTPAPMGEVTTDMPNYGEDIARSIADPAAQAIGQGIGTAVDAVKPYAELAAELAGRVLPYTPTGVLARSVASAVADSQVGSGFVSTFAHGNPKSVGGTVEAVGHLPGVPDAFIDLGKRLQAVGLETAEKYKGRVPDWSSVRQDTPAHLVEDSVDWLMYSLGSMGASSMPSLVTATAVTAVTKNPYAGVAAAFVPSYALNAGELFNELTGEGVPPEEASPIALLVGIPMAVPDAIGAEFLISPLFKGGKEAVKKAIRKGLVRRLKDTLWRGVKKGAPGAAVESGGEFFQEDLAYVTTKLTTGQPIVVSEMLSRGAQAAIPAGLMGFGGRGGASEIGRAAQPSLQDVGKETQQRIGQQAQQPVDVQEQAPVAPLPVPEVQGQAPAAPVSVPPKPPAQMSLDEYRDHVIQVYQGNSLPVPEEEQIRKSHDAELQKAGVQPLGEAPVAPIAAPVAPEAGPGEIVAPAPIGEAQKKPVLADFKEFVDKHKASFPDQADVVITPAQPKTADEKALVRVGKRLGRGVIFVSADTELAGPAFTTGSGRIVVQSGRVGKAMLKLFNHEMVHTLKKSDPEAYSWLVSQLQARSDNLLELGKDIYMGRAGAQNAESIIDQLKNSPDTMTEEGVAQLVELVTPDMVQDMAQLNRPLLQRIRSIVRTVVDRISGKGKRDQGVQLSEGFRNITEWVGMVDRALASVERVKPGTVPAQKVAGSEGIDIRSAPAEAVPKGKRETIGSYIRGVGGIRISSLKDINGEWRGEFYDNIKGKVNRRGKSAEGLALGRLKKQGLIGEKGVPGGKVPTAADGMAKDINSNPDLADLKYALAGNRDVTDADIMRALSNPDMLKKELVAAKDQVEEAVEERNARGKEEGDAERARIEKELDDMSKAGSVADPAHFNALSKRLAELEEGPASGEVEAGNFALRGRQEELAVGKRKVPLGAKEGGARTQGLEGTPLGEQATERKKAADVKEGEQLGLFAINGEERNVPIGGLWFTRGEVDRGEHKKHLKAAGITAPIPEEMITGHKPEKRKVAKDADEPGFTVDVRSITDAEVQELVDRFNAENAENWGWKYTPRSLREELDSLGGEYTFRGWAEPIAREVMLKKFGGKFALQDDYSVHQDATDDYSIRSKDGEILREGLHFNEINPWLVELGLREDDTPPLTEADFKEYEETAARLQRDVDESARKLLKTDPERARAVIRRTEGEDALRRYEGKFALSPENQSLAETYWKLQRQVHSAKPSEKAALRAAVKAAGEKLRARGVSPEDLNEAGLDERRAGKFALSDKSDRNLIDAYKKKPTKAGREELKARGISLAGMAQKALDTGKQTPYIAGADQSRRGMLVPPAAVSRGGEAGSEPMSSLRSQGYPVDRNGGMNASGQVRFAITGSETHPERTAEAWMEKFYKDPLLRRIYSKHDRASFLKGMRATIAIFGDELVPVTAEDVGSPFRKNEDPLFKVTFDLSTICPQQDLYVALLSRLEGDLGKVLPAPQRFGVGLLIEEAGHKPACWYCYGQSGRNKFDFAVQQAANLIKAVQKSGSYDPKTLQKMTGHPTAPTESVLLRVREHLESGGKNIAGPRLLDIIEGRAEPKTKREAALAEGVRSWAQSGTKRNKPKGRTEYWREIFEAVSKQIPELNKSAGMRLNSQTDFRPWHTVDTAQMLAHLKAKNGQAHAYTRVPEFLEIFGKTGIKFNMSTEVSMPSGVLQVLPKNPDGKPADLSYKAFKALHGTHGDPTWNDMNEMPHDTAMAFRKRFPRNAGTMLVPTNDYAVWWGLDSPKIDMMIPYHAGAVPKVVTVAQNARDYTYEQHEKWPDDWKIGETRTMNMSDGTEIALTMKKARAKGKDVAVAPSLTREHHQNNRARYLELAKKFGFTPRFSRFSSHPRYMKLVRDVARSPSSQQAVDPTKIDWGAAQRLLDGWVKKGGVAGDVKVPDALYGWVKGEVDAGRLPDPTKVQPQLVQVAPAPASKKPTKASGQFAIAMKQDPINQPIAPVFYSALRQGVDAIDFKSMPAADLLSRIKKTQGIKKDELDATGFEAWLKSQGKVTKQDVQDYLDENSVEVRIVLKGGDRNISLDKAREIIAGGGAVHAVERRNEESVAGIVNDSNAILPYVESHPELYYFREGDPDAAIRREGADPKFSDYQLPGAKEGSYREMLITLPTDQSPERLAFDEFKQKMQNKYAAGGQWVQKLTAQEEVTRERLARDAAHSEDKGYRSPHWDEANVLVHWRMNERVVDGKRILFLEEIQSDWLQAGRKKGYATGREAEELAVAKKELSDAQQAYDKLPPETFQKKLSEVMALPEAQRVNRAKEEFYRLNDKALGAVPEAPFKSSWSTLALKHAIRYAAENGMDRIAWTTGEQQADRYDLSKQVERVAYNDHKRLLVYGKAGDQILNATLKDDSELEGHVGKEVADRILGQMADQPKTTARIVARERWDGSIPPWVRPKSEWLIVNQEGEVVADDHDRAMLEKNLPKHNRGSREVVLRGLDLKVGGEGMKSFYDKMVPNALKGILKKLDKAHPGVDVVEMDMPNAPVGSLSYEVLDRDGEVYDGFRTQEQAQEFIDGQPEGEYTLRDMSEGESRPASQQLSAEITPAVRDAVLTKGQALFAIGEGEQEPEIKKRRLVQSLENAGMEAGTDKTYGVKHNKETIRKAEAMMKDPPTAYKRVMETLEPDKSGRIREAMPEDVVASFMLIDHYEARGNELIDEYLKKHDPKGKRDNAFWGKLAKAENPEARAVLDNYDMSISLATMQARKQTRSGQETQANAMVSRLSRQAVMVAGLKAVRKINESKKAWRKTGGDQEFTIQDQQTLMVLVDQHTAWEGMSQSAQEMAAVMDKMDRGEQLMATDLEILKKFNDRIKALIGETAKPERKPSTKKGTGKKATKSALFGALGIDKEGAATNIPENLKGSKRAVWSALDSAERAAQKRRADRKKGVRAQAGIDPNELADLAIIGAAKLGKRGLKFAQWADAMVTDEGEWIRPHLKRIFGESQKKLTGITGKATKAYKQAQKIDKLIVKLEEDVDLLGIAWVKPDIAFNLGILTDRIKKMTGEQQNEAAQELLIGLDMLKEPGLLQKLESGQTIGQLLNPTTIVTRNPIGNEFAWRIHRLDTYFRTPLDWARSKITGGDRTITFKKAQEPFWHYWMHPSEMPFVQGLDKGVRMGWKGIQSRSTRWELGGAGGLTFRGRSETRKLVEHITGRRSQNKDDYTMLKYMEKALGATLYGFDEAAHNRVYVTSLGTQAEVAWINLKNKPDMPRKEWTKRWMENADDAFVEKATALADYLTFQDNSSVAKASSAVKRGLNFNQRFGFGSLMWKYPKTPANLLKMGIEHSPAGFIKFAAQVTRRAAGDTTVDAEALERAFSQAAVGTLGLTGVGIMLAATGALTGDDDDQKARNLREQMGIQRFALNGSAIWRWAFKPWDFNLLTPRNGDRWFSYDWAQPMSVAIAAGATGYEAYTKGKDNIWISAMKGLAAAEKTIEQMSVLRGIEDAYRAYRKHESLPGVAGEFVLQVPASFAPSFLNKVADLVGPNERKQTFDINPAIRSMNRAISKIPFLREGLATSYRVWGEDVPQKKYETGDNVLYRAFLAMIAPYRESIQAPTKEQSYILDLYRSTGESSVLPKASWTFNRIRENNETYDLTGNGISRAQRTYAKLLSGATRGLPEYLAGMDDLDAAGYVSSVFRDIWKQTKIQMIMEYERGNRDGMRRRGE